MYFNVISEGNPYFCKHLSILQRSAVDLWLYLSHQGVCGIPSRFFSAVRRANIFLHDSKNEVFVETKTFFFFALIFQYSNMHEHRAVSQLLEGLGARRLSHHYSMHEVCEVASIGNLQMLRHMVHNGATVCYRDFNKRTPL